MPYAHDITRLDSPCAHERSDNAHCLAVSLAGELCDDLVHVVTVAVFCDVRRGHEGFYVLSSSEQVEKHGEVFMVLLNAALIALMYCVPVTLDELKEGVDHIRDLAHKLRDPPVTIHNNTVMPEYLRRLEQKVINDREKRKIINGLNRLEQRYQPDRYGGKNKEENIANKLIATLERTGHLEHKQRVGLVWLLDDQSWTRQEIINLFLSNASDASARGGEITRYQVDHVLNWKRDRQVRS